MNGAAEKMIGWIFSDQERRLMAADLGERLCSFEALRREHFPNELAPAFLFNSLPRGFQIEKEEKPPVWEPANKLKRQKREEDPAFATVADLACLIRSQQITSAGVTRFLLKIFQNPWRDWAPENALDL